MTIDRQVSMNSRAIFFHNSDSKSAIWSYPLYIWVNTLYRVGGGGLKTIEDTHQAYNSIQLCLFMMGLSWPDGRLASEADESIQNTPLLWYPSHSSLAFFLVSLISFCIFSSQLALASKRSSSDTKNGVEKNTTIGQPTFNSRSLNNMCWWVPQRCELREEHVHSEDCTKNNDPMIDERRPAQLQKLMID